MIVAWLKYFLNGEFRAKIPNRTPIAQCKAIMICAKKFQKTENE